MHIAGSTISQMGQMQGDAKQLHDEVMALMIAQPDLTSSDRSSVSDKIHLLFLKTQVYRLPELSPAPTIGVST
jgi:hypothetical protein